MLRPIEIFFSYAHEDQELVHEVRGQLILFEKQRVITNWYDRLIPPGTDWKGQIDEHLERADIILLLVSPDFFKSDYCHDVEMRAALKRHDSGAARVIPVLLRPCAWESAPFAWIQALPAPAKPITSWDNRDEACFNVAEGIMAAVRHMVSTRPESPAAEEVASPEPRQRSSGPPSPAADPELAGVRCESILCRSPDVEVSDSAEITLLTATTDGWLAHGTLWIEYTADGHCRTCGRVLEVARRSIPVQFPDLTCEGCGQNAFLQYSVRSLRKIATGYEFEVLARCTACHGQRTVSHLLSSPLRTASIDVALTGMKVQLEASSRV